MQPLDVLVSRLLAVAPDLIFNTAEGVTGPHREALYPCIFEELGIPYTGSGPAACLVSLDKHLTKVVLGAAGVPVAWGTLVRRGDVLPQDVPLPAFTKPNYEGSSKGIGAASICRTRAALEARVDALLGEFPDGVLVEEYVEGVDVVVPWIAGSSPETGGVLEPGSYRFSGTTGPSIYDYALKNEDSSRVEVVVPAEVSPEVRAELLRVARIAFEALDVRDLGRIDFRVRADGTIVFIELNALPSLEPGATLYASAALAGLTDEKAVLGQVVASATRRAKARPTRAGRSKPLRVGLFYNLKRVDGGAGHAAESGSDAEAEFDSWETVSAVRDAIASRGHEVLLLEADADLPRRFEPRTIDVAFNMAEGRAGRGREALVPALMDHYGIEHTGSDAATLAVTLDKAFAKRVVGDAGVPTPAFFVARKPTTTLPAGMAFPVIVKPAAEGSSKGVVDASVARDGESLRRAIEQVTSRYGQAALVESWLPGREFTVGLLGDVRVRVLPPLEVRFTGGEEHPVYGYLQKKDSRGVAFDCPAQVDAALGRELERVARAAWTALGCRDVARIDLRLDTSGRPNFIECNPLPGLTPGWSDLCVIAEAAGLDHPALIDAILRPAMRRHRARRAARPVTARAEVER
jgi:D-alanine-D-alanine ligase